MVLFAIGVPKAVAGDDHNPPSAPTNVRVLATSQTSVTVVWDASTDDVSVKYYRLWLGYPPSLRTKETQYTVTGLRCGQSITLELRAFDNGNNPSEPTLTVVSSAPCVDTQPPAPPAGLRQVAASAATATLAWNAASDNVAVAGYSLSRAGVEVGTTSETIYSFSGLACGKTHLVAVRSYDVARNYSSWVSYYVTTAGCGDVSPPSAPSGLVQTNRTTTGMSVAWSASTDNVGVARYDVFRDGTPAGSASSVSHVLSGLTCGTAYTVGVEAVDGAGNRSARTSAALSTAPCVSPPPPPTDNQPPTTPTNLALNAASSHSMTLSWSPSTDNVGVTGYRVYHDGAQVQVVTGTTFVYQGLSCGTSHELGVRSQDATGNHSGLASVVASTAPCSDASPPTPPQNLVVLTRTSSSVTVSWAAATDDIAVAGYGAYVGARLDGSTGATTYTFAGLACNAFVTVGVDAYDALGNRSPRVMLGVTTTACGDTQAPTSPSQLNVTNQTQNGLTLNWTASTDNSAVSGYDVYANGTKQATVTGTSHTLANLACSATYQLAVEAFDGSGNRSARSSVFGATTQCSEPTPPPPPPPPSGGSGTVFVSPNGTDTGSCSQSAPCQSFNRAYVVAPPGATVNVASGTYPSQTISWIPGRDAAAQVRFVPQGPITIMGSLVITASGVYIDGSVSGSLANWRSRSYSITATEYVSVEAVSSTQYPHNVVVEGVDTRNLNTTSLYNVTVRDIDVGPRVIDAPSCGPFENRIGSNGGLSQTATNLVWERVIVHDQNRTQAAAQANCHYGGLIFPDGNGVTLRQVIFERNVVYHISAGNYARTDGPKNVTVENSSFGCPAENSWLGDVCDGQVSIQLSNPGLPTTSPYGNTWNFTNNLSANGPGGLFVCMDPPCGSFNPLSQGNADLTRSVVAPALNG